MRVSEVAGLRMQDADLENRLILIHQGKGEKYSVRTLQILVENAALKAGMAARVTCHGLRHSFAAHLLESGVDVKTIKELPGHKSVRAAMGYLHVAQMRYIRVKSPLS